MTLPSTAPQVVIVQIPKSPMLAAVLAFFFGPLGLLYVGFVPALIALLVGVPLVLLTAGLGLIIFFPMCAIVAWSRANLYNKQLHQGR